MSISTKIFGALGLAFMALGMQLPAEAQTIEESAAATPPAEMQTLGMQGLDDPTNELQAEPQTEIQSIPVMPSEVAPIEAVAPTEVDPIEAASWTQSESLTAEALQPGAAALETTGLEADGLTYPASPESQEIAQARRRTTRNTAGGSDFIGIGADFGYADNVSFAAISKLSLSDQVALRPSVLLGDDLSILVPVTYDFSNYSGEVSGFQFLPYAGVGASYQDGDGEDFNLLLAAGADVPLSRQFTLNAQANVGVLNGTDFGVTVGVGYNFGDLFR